MIDGYMRRFEVAHRELVAMDTFGNLEPPYSPGVAFCAAYLKSELLTLKMTEQVHTEVSRLATARVQPTSTCELQICRTNPLPSLASREPSTGNLAIAVPEA